MAFDKIFQVYTKSFDGFASLNTFLQQFTSGELEPINVIKELHAPCFDSLKVIFKTTRDFSPNEIEEFGLYDGLSSEKRIEIYNE